MFVLELQADDLHNALVRLLDQARVAGLKISAIAASEAPDGFEISATFDESDREAVEKLGRRLARTHGATVPEVRAVMRLHAVDGPLAPAC